MSEVNKEHLQLAAVIAAGVIQATHQTSKPSVGAISQALQHSYEAVQDAISKIEGGQQAK